MVNSTNHSFFKFTEKYGEQLSWASLPSKIVTTLLGWAQFIPMPPKIASAIAGQRSTIKTVSSTFAVPKFFLAQSKLAESSLDLKNKLSATSSSNKVAESVKRTFFAFLSSVIAFFKLPQTLDKTRVIDLSKISRILPNVLAKGENLISLGLYSTKTADAAWTLKNQLSLSKGRVSSSVKKSILKLGSNSLKLLSNSLSAASLFLEWYTNPVLAATISTASLGVTLFGKIASIKKSFWKGASKTRDAAFASLPA